MFRLQFSSTLWIALVLILWLPAPRADAAPRETTGTSIDSLPEALAQRVHASLPRLTHDEVTRLDGLLGDYSFGSVMPSLIPGGALGAGIWFLGPFVSEALSVTPFFVAGMAVAAAMTCGVLAYHQFIDRPDIAWKIEELVVRAESRATAPSRAPAREPGGSASTESETGPSFDDLRLVNRQDL